MTELWVEPPTPPANDRAGIAHDRIGSLGSRPAQLCRGSRVTGASASILRGDPRVVLAALVFAIGLLLSVGHGSSFRAADLPIPRPRPGAQEALGTTPPQEGAFPGTLQLEGRDDSQGALAALALVQGAVGDDPAASAMRERHIAWIERSLDPEKWRDPALDPAARARRRTAALRIVGAIAAVCRLNGELFPGGDSLLVDLLGRGDEALRSAVVDALVACLGLEDSRTRPREAGSLKAKLGELVSHNPPPPREALADASRVLWRADGRSFLVAAFEGLRHARDRFPEATPGYVDEIRARLRIDFPTVDDWLAWWESQDGASLAEIFAACQQILGEDAARTFRASIRRLREARDPVRVWQAIEETLRTSRSPDVRSSAVVALGEFGEWGREVTGTDPEPRVEPGAPSTSASTLGVIFEQAFDTLRALAAGEDSLGAPTAELRRAALAGLRRYQGLLSRDPKRRAAAAKLVLTSLGRSTPGAEGYAGGSGQRADLVEALRTAAALRVTEARPTVERLLRQAGSERDFEVLRASAAALGRIIEGDLGMETARLLIDTYRLDPPQPTTLDETLELRAACLAALNGRPADLEVRKLLRGLYDEILGGEPGPLRIRAILGLGTLARDRDEVALDRLTQVISAPARFEVQEIVAAINALGYVGGPEATNRLVDLLAGAPAALSGPNPVRDELRRKVVAAVEAGGAPELARVYGHLESRALEKDAQRFLDLLAELGEEPALVRLRTPEPPTGEDGARLDAAFAASISYARATELRADAAEKVAAVTKTLLDFVEKNPELRDPHAGAIRQLEGYLRRRASRLAATQAFADPMLDGRQLIERMQAAVPADGTAFDRWFGLLWAERQLFRLDPSSPIIAGWIERLAILERSSVTVGLPDGMLERSAERLRAPRRSPAVPGTGSSGPGAPPLAPSSAGDEVEAVPRQGDGGSAPVAAPEPRR